MYSALSLNFVFGGNCALEKISIIMIIMIIMIIIMINIMIIIIIIIIIINISQWRVNSKGCI